MNGGEPYEKGKNNKYNDREELSPLRGGHAGGGALLFAVHDPLYPGTAQYRLCHALEELHSLGIVHRDIKPANVMITPVNRAVLLDLSIAREISSDQQDTRSLGTVGYAAPEQYGVAQSNRATDLYALGVLLNTMITGVHPAVDIPRGPIRHIVQKATDTQISKRYKSAAAMARALRPYVRL